MKQEEKRKRPAASADHLGSKQQRPTKRRKETSNITPETKQNLLTNIGRHEGQTKSSSSSRLTPDRSIMSDHLEHAFSPANDLSPIQRNQVTPSLPPVTSTVINKERSIRKSWEVHAVHTSNVYTPACAISCSQGTGFPSVTTSAFLGALDDSRLSLVPTENSSEVDFELDEQDAFFREWESLSSKPLPLITPTRITIGFQFLIISLCAILVMSGIFLQGLNTPHVAHLIQGFADEMASRGVIYFKNGLDSVKLTETEKELESTIHNLLSTSSALQASQQKIESMVQELKLMREASERLEQQLQEMSKERTSTNDSLESVSQLLEDTTKELRTREHHLLASQEEVAHLAYDLQQLQKELRGTLAELEVVTLGKTQSLEALEHTQSMLQTAIARLQQSSKAQSQVHNSLLEASITNFGTSLELLVLHNEISDLQMLLASQGLTNTQSTTLSDQLSVAEISPIGAVDVYSQLQVELEVKTKTIQQFEALTADARRELVDAQNELRASKDTIAQLEHEHLLYTASHQQTKDEMFSTLSELWETQIALNNAIVVLLEFEEEINSLYQQLEIQERVSAHTVNYVATLAINEQQQAAAQVVNILTTFASQHHRKVHNEEAAHIVNFMTTFTIQHQKQCHHEAITQASYFPTGMYDKGDLPTCLHGNDSSIEPQLD